MIEFVKPVAERAAGILEVAGIIIIVVIAAVAIMGGLLKLLKKQDREKVYQEVRQRLGRGILLGLEFLVAADIIHTVAVELTFKTVGVLAIIVLIRTFLSFTLEVELTGRWPWQNES